MDKNLLIKRMQNIGDIYTFVTMIYEFISTDSKQQIEKKYIQIINDKHTGFLKKISNLVENLSIVNQFEFKDWLECWIEEFNKSEMDSKTFCYVTLLKVDDIICDLLPNKKIVVSKGPLNGSGTSFFYYKKPCSYFDNKLKKGKIRKGRQTVEYETNTINSNFNNFEVVESNCLYNYKPQVNYYNHNVCFDKMLKIGVSPISNKIWFIPNFDKKMRMFTVNYDSNSNYNHNEHIKDILLEFERLEVDIVLFPELSMNVETEQEIRKLIISLDFQNIKLFFLGSVWNNNINESVLMSNQGTVLIREQKQIPYKKYFKDINGYCTESINSDKKIQLLDIYGVGRIAYLICADYNDDSINAICSLLHVDFIIVSAYTNDTTLMLETAISHAKRKGITTVLSNSCAALVDDDKCKAFVVIPKVENEHLQSEVYVENNNCNVECIRPVCVNIFSINQE